MRQTILAVAALSALAACRREAPAPAEPAPDAGPAAAPSGRPFGLADLAAARLLDARLARLDALALDLHGALPEGAAERRGGGAAALAPRIEAAAAEVERALAGVAHPLDRVPAARAADAARELAAAAREPASPEKAAALASARNALGRRITEYRLFRAEWRPEPSLGEGAERRIEEAGRELDRVEIESAVVTEVAPRSEGHRLDAGGARLSVEAAVRRAREAVNSVEPALRPAAARWADAAGVAAKALLRLSAAAPAERPALARAWAAARADALEALAEWTRLRAARGG